MSYTLSTFQILNDLQEIYLHAMEEKNFSIALKAKELQAKELESASKKKNWVDLDNLAEEDIERILEIIEKECPSE